MGDDHTAESYESHQQNELSLLVHLICGFTSRGLDLIDQDHFVVHDQDQGRVHEVDLGGVHHGQQSGPDRLDRGLER